MNNQPIQQVLTDLNSVAGVKGCMVVTQDGMVVASDLRGLPEETVAAVSSRFLKAAREQGSALGLTKFTRLVLEGTHGKIVLVPTGHAFLVVVADMRMDMDASFIEIASAARRIEAYEKLHVGPYRRRAHL